jgi:hypothetical protein
MRAFLLFAVVASASAVSLTDKTFDAATAGKTVFIKFQAPW